MNSQTLPFRTRFNPEPGITTNTYGASKVDLSKQEETDIYAVMRKYNVTPEQFEQRTRPEHELFIDTTIIPKNMTLSQAVEFKNQFVDYFQAAPAKFRRLFKDNPDNFYLAYKQGEYENLIKYGALTQEQVNQQKEAIKAELRPMQDKIAAYETQIAEERAKNERLNALLNANEAKKVD